MSFGRSTAVPFEDIQQKRGALILCAPLLVVGGLVPEAPCGVFVPSLAWKAYLS